jgi:hypothetical protein
MWVQLDSYQLYPSSSLLKKKSFYFQLKYEAAAQLPQVSQQLLNLTHISINTVLRFSGEKGSAA